MNEGPQQTRPSLLLRLKDGDDPDDWETFVSIYSPLVFRFCRTRNLQPNDAADITQEVLLRVYKSIKRFDYDPRVGRFRGWLSTVVHNEIKRQAARRKLPVVASDEREVAESEQWFDEQFHAHVLATAMERIRPRYEPTTWMAFERTWLRMEDAAVVAGDLRVPIDRVYLAKCRVLKQLRREVSLLADDGI